jgi:hypothetical protein
MLQPSPCCEQSTYICNFPVVFDFCATFNRSSLDSIFVKSFLQLGHGRFLCGKPTKQNPKFIWNFLCQFDQNVWAPTIKNQLLFVLEL